MESCRLNPRSIDNFNVGEFTDLKRYRSVFEQFPLGIIHIDNQGIVFDCNDRYAQILCIEKEKVIGSNVFETCGPQKIAFRKALQDGLGHFEGPHGQKPNIVIRAIYKKIKLSNGHSLGVIGVIEDNHEKVQTEKRLWKDEKRLHLISQTIPDGLAVFDGNTLLWGNNRFYEIFDVNRDREQEKHVLSKLIELGTGKTFDDKGLYWKHGPRKAVGIRNGGKRFPIEIRSSVVNEGIRNVVIYSITDVTDKKKLESEIEVNRQKLRRLASQLSVVEEKERGLTASFIHDHISQNLAFAKIRLTELQKINSSSKLSGLLQEITELVEKTIDGARTLISENGSHILSELGLIEAIRWLCQQTEKQHGIKLLFRHDNRALSPKDSGIQILLFRTVRELLINIVKHAGVKEGSVYVCPEGKAITVMVSDDGVGFDPVRLRHRLKDGPGGFGLLNIQERLESFGGCFEVVSEPNHGTLVKVIVPLD